MHVKTAARKSPNHTKFKLIYRMQQSEFSDGEWKKKQFKNNAIFWKKKLKISFYEWA